jgi:hypothetical protein
MAKPKHRHFTHGDTIIGIDTTFEIRDSEGQYLEIRVGPVFKADDKMDRQPAIWISYQVEYGKSELLGPVLISPVVWKKISAYVESRIEQFRPGNYRLRNTKPRAKQP